MLGTSFESACAADVERAARASFAHAEAAGEPRCISVHRHDTTMILKFLCRRCLSEALRKTSPLNFTIRSEPIVLQWLDMTCDPDRLTLDPAAEAFIKAPEWAAGRQHMRGYLSGR